MRHRLDAVGVDGLHFADHREDPRQLGEHLFGLLRAGLDAGEMGDAFDVVEFQGHARFMA